MPPEILRVISGPAEGSTIELNGELSFGRAAGDGGTLGGDPQLSRKHARITRANGGLQIEDLGSTNGTYVNGERVTSPRPIKAGDRIELGDTTLEVGQGERLTTVAPVVDSRDENGEAPTSINAVLPPSGPPVEPGAATGSPAGAATPGTRPPVRPPARVDDPRHPATGRGGGGGASRAPALLAALIGLLIGAGIIGIIWAADGSASDSGVEKFSLMAEGFSTEVLDEKSKQREITITMRTFEAPHDIQQLRVHKFLDETRPPPQRTYDAIYTFTAKNGDSLVLSAAGDVTEPEGPDGTFGQTFEQWRVVDGTGIFEGARGEGTVTTAVLVASRKDPEPGSDVVKHIVGDIELAD